MKLATPTRFASDTVWARAVEPWTGPVLRRDPASYRQRSVHYTWRCPNPSCGHWTMNSAWKYGRCNFCGTPRPADDPSAPSGSGK